MERWKRSKGKHAAATTAVTRQQSFKLVPAKNERRRKRTTEITRAASFGWSGALATVDS